MTRSLDWVQATNITTNYRAQYQESTVNHFFLPVGGSAPFNASPAWLSGFLQIPVPEGENSASISELGAAPQSSAMDMVIDTFPQYRLWKSSLLGYLKQQFPTYSNDISVEEHGTVYRLTIPQKLTSAQRNYILNYVRYRPDSDDD